MPEAVSTRPLLDKLGVRPGARIGLVGLDAPWFEALLAERTQDVWRARARADTDLIFFGADSHAELARLPALLPKIRQNGAIWVVSRKGRAATLRDVEVIEAGLAAGLVDNKVVSFSETQTSLRLVIRLRDRRPEAPEADAARSGAPDVATRPRRG